MKVSLCGGFITEVRYLDILHSNSSSKSHKIRCDSTGKEASSQADMARSSKDLKLSSSPESIKSLAYATTYDGQDMKDLYFDKPSSNTRAATYIKKCLQIR